MKYPNITADLSGTGQNAIAIMNRVRRALRANKVPEAQVAEFSAEATRGNYNHLMKVVRQWVSITGD